jgi:LCP family protein required for cell wall assembly
MNLRVSAKTAGFLIVCGAIAVLIGYLAFRPAARLIAVEMVSKPVTAVEQYFIPAPEKLFGKSSVRVLLVGLDYDYNDQDQESSKSARSDIIMAIGLDFRHHRVTELSVPRDMVATMPNGRLAKINQAQSDGGIRESQAVVAQWLGIPPFDRYIVLRINTAKDLVNAIGGVDVVVRNSDALKGTGKNGPIDYDDHWGHLSIHLKPGMQHLNGDQAVAYARFRHDWCSDPCRIMRQQQMIHAVLNTIQHNQWNTLTHVQALLNVVRKDVDTNFTSQEEFSTVVAFSDLTAKKIVTAQVPYRGTVVLPDYGDSLLPNETEKARLVAAMLADRPDDVAATAPGNTTIAPASIRVRVENGTLVLGLASRIADDLRRQGFTISEVGNASSHDLAVTEIQSGIANSPASYAVRKALGKNAASAVITATTSAAGSQTDVTVVLGNDIVGGKP